jgi:hypothetical protein
LVTERNQRYNEFFFVIRDSDFRALRPGLDALFEPVAAAED